MREGHLGWATNSLVKLDDQAPGVLARVLTASAGRRQAIFAAVAVHTIKGDVYRPEGDLFPPGLADVIRHGRGSEILRQAFGDVPHGLPGLLSRIGQKPLDCAHDYLVITGLLSGKNSRTVEALRGAGRISRRSLEVLAALDPRWHHANALTRLDTPAEAMRFNRSVDFVQSVCSRADDEAVATAIANLTSSSTLAWLVERFVRRADRLPEHPVQVEDNELRPFTTMRDYLEAGRRYRNCLVSKLGHVAAGRLCIAEFRGEALLEFRRLTGGAWLLWAIHGHRNSGVPPHICEAAEAKIDSLGIPRIDENAGGSRWSSYRSFTRELDWD